MGWQSKQLLEPERILVQQTGEGRMGDVVNFGRKFPMCLKFWSSEGKLDKNKMKERKTNEQFTHPCFIIQSKVLAIQHFGERLLFLLGLSQTGQGHTVLWIHGKRAVSYAKQKTRKNKQKRSEQKNRRWTRQTGSQLRVGSDIAMDKCAVYGMAARTTQRVAAAQQRCFQSAVWLKPTNQDRVVDSWTSAFGRFMQLGRAGAGQGGAGRGLVGLRNNTARVEDAGLKESERIK